MLMTALHAVYEPPNAWLSELSVPAQMFLPPDTRLFQNPVVMDARGTEERADLIDLYGPALVNEVDDSMGGCRQSRLVVKVSESGRPEPEAVV